MDSGIEAAINIGLPLLLLAVTYFTGRRVERQHYASIRARENELRMLPAVTFRQIPSAWAVDGLGVVSGSTVRSKHIGRDLMAGIKNIFGGELKGYTELLQESREDALARMVKEAESLGANAIVNVRFATSSITQGAAELFAYGTAVQVD